MMKKKEETARRRVNIAKQLLKQFKKSQTYAKNVFVTAIRVTESMLAEIKAEGTTRDNCDDWIYYDKKTGNFTIDTKVMERIPIPGQPGHFTRSPKFECSHVVKPGDWIVTNPKFLPTDCNNSYPVSDEVFRQRYEATDELNVYHAKGLARIIRNPYGCPVVIKAPWGEEQEGNEFCYFCVPVDPEHPEDIDLAEGYILSENDLRTYAPAAEVLGPDWELRVLKTTKQ